MGGSLIKIAFRSIIGFGYDRNFIKKAYLLLAGFEVFDSSLGGNIDRDEPFGVQLEGALELLVRLGFKQWVLSGQA